MKDSRLISRPKDFVINGVVIAKCVYGYVSRRKVRFTNNNIFEATIRDSTDAKKLSSWLLKAAKWIEAGR